MTDLIDLAQTDTDAALAARGVTLAYDQRVISEDLFMHVPAGSFTAIVGPNACGKSTLLRALSRLLAPRTGQIVLNGRDIADRKSKELARELGLLPQTSLAPDGIRVADLVARGRFPHQKAFDRWSAQDEEAVREAMVATDVMGLAGRLVDELSGGQRQRVWVAMVLAQQTSTLLLDEPTTFLDIAHQVEILELFKAINVGAGHTLVAVLHDLNQAARYASHMIVMKDGRVVTSGHPSEVLTAETVAAAFGLACRIIDDPETGTPLVIPLAR